MGRKYLNPRAAGYLLEAKACDIVCRELRRLIEKYKRAVDKEAAARQSEFETVLQYRNELEIQNDYGYDLITQQQYERYLDLFREGQAAVENRPATLKEMALSILRRIESDIAEDRREWEFSALSPEEQQAERERAEQSQKAWKERIAEIKKKRGLIDND